MSDAARLQVAQTLLDALPAQNDPALARACARAVGELASAAGGGAAAFRGLVEQAQLVHGSDARVAAQLQWLRGRLAR
jgi:hypothetical protein